VDHGLIFHCLLTCPIVTLAERMPVPTFSCGCRHSILYKCLHSCCRCCVYCYNVTTQLSLTSTKSRRFCCANSTTFLAPAVVSDIGFSQTTCLPAVSIMSDSDTCEGLSVAIYTTSVTHNTNTRDKGYTRIPTFSIYTTYGIY